MDHIAPPQPAKTDVGFLRRYARPHRRQLMGIATLHLVFAGLTAASPWPAKIAVDNVLRGRELPEGSALDDLLDALGPTGSLVLLAILTVVFVVARGLVTAIQQVQTRTVGSQMSHELAYDALSAIQQQSSVATATRRSGDLVQRVTADTRCVDSLVFGVWMSAYRAAVTFGIMFVIMWSLSPWLTIAAVGAAVPMPLVVKLFSRQMSDNAVAEAMAAANTASVAEQMLGAVAEIQTFGAEDRERAHFERTADQQVEVATRTQRTYLRYGLAIGSLTALGTAAVMIIAGGVTTDSISVGVILVFISYIERVVLTDRGVRVPLPNDGEGEGRGGTGVGGVGWWWWGGGSGGAGGGAGSGGGWWVVGCVGGGDVRLCAGSAGVAGCGSSGGGGAGGGVGGGDGGGEVDVGVVDPAVGGPVGGSGVVGWARCS